MTARWMSTMWMITRANGSKIPISPMNLRSVRYEIRRVSAGSVVVVLTAGASFHQSLPRRAAGIPVACGRSPGWQAIARLPGRRRSWAPLIQPAGEVCPIRHGLGQRDPEPGAVRRDGLAFVSAALGPGLRQRGQHGGEDVVRPLVQLAGRQELDGMRDVDHAAAGHAEQAGL